MQAKKIIIICNTDSDFYNFRKDLIKALIMQGNQVFAFMSEYRDDGLERVRVLGATPVIYHINRGGLNPIADIIATIKLSKQIKQINPDIVLSSFAKPVIFGTLAARMAKVAKVVGMLEGLGFTFTEQPEGLATKTKIIRAIQVFLYKIALPKLDTLIFLNPDDPKDLVEKYKINTRNIQILGGIGLNLKDFPYQPVSLAQPFRFLFIGRLLREKGIYEFIAAAKVVKQKYPNTIFTVLGRIDSANLGALSQQELDDFIQSGLIEYPGHVSNVSEWIVKSHIFVLPSYREGVPRSTQEAMAIGRAIITTDVAGCRETVVDGINGFLVPKWNATILAEKMIYFIQNPEQMRTMGDASHQIAVNKFDADIVNSKLLAILES